jgi:hypothetical protein
MILSFSSPIAITVIILVAVVLLNSLRRRIRAARHRFGPGGPKNPHGIHRWANTLHQEARSANSFGYPLS